MIDVKDNAGQPLGAGATLRLSDRSKRQVSISTDENGALHFPEWESVDLMKVWPNGGHWKQMIERPKGGTSIFPDQITTEHAGWWHKKLGLKEGLSQEDVAIGVIDHASTRVVRSHDIEVVDHFDSQRTPIDSHGDHVCQVLLGRFESSHYSTGVIPLNPVPKLHFYNISPPMSDLIGTQASTSTALVQGIVFLSHFTDAAIINISQGFLTDEPSETLEAAVHAAKLRGVLCIAASGNDPNAQVANPARLSDVVAVGGVGLKGLGPENSYVQYLERVAQEQFDNNDLGQSSEWFCCPNSSFRGGVDLVGPSSGIILTNSDGYAIDFEGTSYASPVVVHALTKQLKNSAEFQTLSGVERFNFLRETLYSICQPIGLPQEREGKGLPVCTKT